MEVTTYSKKRKADTPVGGEGGASIYQHSPKNDDDNVFNEVSG